MLRVGIGGRCRWFGGRVLSYSPDSPVSTYPGDIKADEKQNNVPPISDLSLYDRLCSSRSNTDFVSTVHHINSLRTS